MTGTEACIALNMVPKMGPVRMRKLLEVFETPERILSATVSRLRSVDGIGNDIATTISKWEEHVDLPAELRRIEEFGAHVLTQESPDYPRLLREIHNPPIVLYVWGELTDRDNHAVGVVGSRQASHYGLDCTKRLSYQLAYAGMTVASGLARGIDTAAHQAALAAKGRTVAVLGSGLNRLYPTENLPLAEKIAAGSGAVITEFPMEVNADTQTFPMRNRIVSGMSSSLLVVEAGLNSGALITSSQAIDQGRSVYAVPGPINRPTSAGTNRLIQQGAKLVTCAADILDDLQILFPEVPKPTAAGLRPDLLNDEERKVYDAIGDSETPMDEVITKSGLPTAKVSSTLLTLEMKRMVKQLPARHFVKLI